MIYFRILFLTLFCAVSTAEDGRQNLIEDNYHPELENKDPLVRLDTYEGMQNLRIYNTRMRNELSACIRKMLIITLVLSIIIKH